MSDALKVTAKRALASLDLTDLNDDCDEDAVTRLCKRAQTSHGPVAAICIWPRFVAHARSVLKSAPIRIATVVNFPGGEDPASEVIALTEQAVRDGADEIDVVIPYRMFIEGDVEPVRTRTQRVKTAADGRVVKAILETGVLQERSRIKDAALLAIDGGADFIKTSTGKVPVNATPRAARIMLEVIAEADRTIGLKPAGGVRSTEDAAVYLGHCDEIMGPDWATPETFRIGASGVLDALIATLDGRSMSDVTKEY